MNDNMKKQLENDKLYDKKSLVYRDGLLEEVEDALDSRDVPEGRFGEFRLMQLRTAMGVTLRLPVTKGGKKLSEAVAAEDTKDCYRLLAEDRLLVLEKADDRVAAQLAADDALIPWENTLESDQVQQWAGVLDSGKYGPMLGIVRIMGGKDGKRYVFKYAGIGNFTDIRMEELELAKNLFRRINR